MADQGIKDKLKALLKDQRLKAEVDTKFSLEHHKARTWNLEALKNSTPMPVVATMGGEGTPLIACRIGHFEGGEFLDIFGRLEFLYIRKGYDELYEDIQALWKTDGANRANKVVLVGNAGTGKSWYQLYILRRLLKRSTDYQNDADDYDFVFRQVGHQHYLIDIKDCVVYQVNSLDVGLLTFLARSLYFFEPGAEVELAPKDSWTAISRHPITLRKADFGIPQIWHRAIVLLAMVVHRDVGHGRTFWSRSQHHTR